MAIVTSCVDLPQFPEQPVTGPTVPGAAPAPPAGAPGVLRLGSWNVRKLGLDAAKDSGRLAAIIDAHFDLVALVEVMWSEDDAGWQALLAALGPTWHAQRTSTPRPNLRSVHAEYYAVAYRSELVAPCPELEGLQFFPDGEGSADSPTRGSFLREPAFACFRAGRAGASRDFLLAVYHAQWGSGSAAEIASEVAHVDAVFETMQRRLPHERELFMIGDFNLTAAQLAPLTRALDRTVGRGSTLDAQGQISEHLYDHLLAYGAANDALVADAQVLDVRGEAFDPAAFRDQVSDHLPIAAQLSLSSDDD